MNEELKITIRQSSKKCCCMKFDDLIFSRLDQAKYILMETFDGKPIMLDGPDGNQIDCMFFPCTSKEEVLVDESVSLDGTVKIKQDKEVTGRGFLAEGSTSTVSNT